MNLSNNRPNQMTLDQLISSKDLKSLTAKVVRNIIDDINEVTIDLF